MFFAHDEHLEREGALPGRVRGNVARRSGRDAPAPAGRIPPSGGQPDSRDERPEPRVRTQSIQQRIHPRQMHPHRVLLAGPLQPEARRVDVAQCGQRPDPEVRIDVLLARPRAQPLVARPGFLPVSGERVRGPEQASSRGSPGRRSSPRSSSSSPTPILPLRTCAIPSHPYMPAKPGAISSVTPDCLTTSS